MRRRSAAHALPAHAPPASLPPGCLAAGWWGEKRFCSAGCLEGLDQAAAEAARRRMTFDEDDQVGLGWQGWGDRLRRRANPTRG